jgi:glycosyltransferase involved in cell wall biosynthesis
MRILQFLEAAATGAGRHVMDLSEGLLARGHDVHLLYSPLRCDRVFEQDLKRLGPQRNFHALPVPVQRYPSVADVRGVATVRRYLRSYGPFDLVHCHSTKAGLIGRMGLIGHAAKRLYTAHGFLSMNPAAGRVIARLAGGLESVLAGFGAGVIVVSREEYRHAVEIGIPPDKLRLIPNGVALNGLIGGERQRSACRRAWGLGESDVCVGFAGRFTRVKAPEMMLDAFAALRRHSKVAARLVMVGDGPLAAPLRRHAAELGLAGEVIWLGAQDARPLMTAFDVLALTSKSEGHSLVVLEGMARGLPIVATAVGGIADTVRPGLNGFVAPVDDAPAIANALEVLAGNPALRQRMGEASRTISLQFSADRMVERTLAFYQEIAPEVVAEKTPAAWKVAASG